MNFNVKTNEIAYVARVSIPNRDLDEFQRKHQQSRVEQIVSIPNRDLDEFQRCHLRRCTCNPSVSIPNRDLDEFQHEEIRAKEKVQEVSIPNRDLDEFQLPSSESIDIFGFQGSVASIWNQDSFSDIGLSRVTF